jgi:gas vesicle protein
MGQNPEELTTETTTTGYTDTGYVEARGTGTGTGVAPVAGASTTPADIEATRASLSRDIDELTEKVSPARVVDRRKQAAKGRLSDVRDKVLGAAPDLSGDAVRSRVPDVSGTASGVTSGAVDTGHTVVAKAQGNPLAAGLVAFGAGLLISALLPASGKETQLAGRAVDAAKEHAQPVLEEAKAVGQQVGEDLKESAVESAQQVKDTAQESAQTVKEQGQSSAQTVQDQGRSSAATVKDEGQSSADTLKQHTTS